MAKIVNFMLRVFYHNLKKIKRLGGYKSWRNEHCGEEGNLEKASQDRRLGSWAFPRGAVVKNSPANAGDTGSSPGLGRSHVPWSN